MTLGGFLKNDTYNMKIIFNIPLSYSDSEIPIPYIKTQGNKKTETDPAGAGVRDTEAGGRRQEGAALQVGEIHPARSGGKGDAMAQPGATPGPLGSLLSTDPGKDRGS